MLTNRIASAEPTFPSSWAVNEIKLDPVTGSRVIRVTDANTLPGNIGQSFGTPSASHQLAWRKNSDGFYLRGSAVTCLPFAFNASSMQVSRLSGTGDGGLVVTTQPEPQFSWVNNDVIYTAGEDGTHHTPIVKTFTFGANTYANLVDLRIQGPTISDNTYCGGIYSCETAPEKIVCWWGGEAGTHFLVGVFEVGNSANKVIIDTQASTIRVNGGAPSATNLSLGFGIHNVHIDRTGRFVSIEVEGTPGSWPSSSKVIWDLTTNTLAVLTPYYNAHSAMGWGDYIGMDGPHPGVYDNFVQTWRDLTNLAATRVLIVDPLAVPEIYTDGHVSWNNAQSGALTPILCEQYRSQDGPNDSPVNAAPFRAWDQQIMSIQTDAFGGSTTVYRHCYHYAIVREDPDTANKGPFWYQPRPNVSPDGRWGLFTTNGQRQLGVTGIQVETNSYHRYDAFLVELLYSDPIPTPTHRRSWSW